MGRPPKPPGEKYIYCCLLLLELKTLSLLSLAQLYDSYSLASPNLEHLREKAQVGFFDEPKEKKEIILFCPR